MRLFLSSYRAGRHDNRLLEFIGNTKKFAYISNAKDYKSDEDRKSKIEENFDYWRSLGLEPIEIDLRSQFHKANPKEIISSYDFVWLAGGNVFLLRRALSYTGLDKYLVEQTQSGQLKLGGESAGAIIMGPTLRHSEVDTDEDSPNYIPAGYDQDVIWSGLGLLDFVPVPHYQALGYIGIDEYIENLEKDSIPYKKMTDDQAIIVNGDKIELLP